MELPIAAVVDWLGKITVAGDKLVLGGDCSVPFDETFVAVIASLPLAAGTGFLKTTQTGWRAVQRACEQVSAKLNY